MRVYNDVIFVTYKHETRLQAEFVALFLDISYQIFDYEKSLDRAMVRLFVYEFIYKKISLSVHKVQYK